jgi:hypothetical protein
VITKGQRQQIRLYCARRGPGYRADNFEAALLDMRPDEVARIMAMIERANGAGEVCAAVAQIAAPILLPPPRPTIESVWVKPMPRPSPGEIREKPGMAARAALRAQTVDASLAAMDEA